MTNRMIVEWRWLNDKNNDKGKVKKQEWRLEEHEVAVEEEKKQKGMKEEGKGGCAGGDDGSR
jgi:hypothetical protein